jgi:hypothetical protein
VDSAVTCTHKRARIAAHQRRFPLWIIQVGRDLFYYAFSILYVYENGLQLDQRVPELAVLLEHQLDGPGWLRSPMISAHL